MRGETVIVMRQGLCLIPSSVLTGLAQGPVGLNEFQ